MSGWNNRWLWRSIRVTSTSAFFSRLATCTPPNPPPTITTRRRRAPEPLADMDGLPPRPGPQSLEQVVADPQPVRHRRQRGVHRADAREEARVDDVQVVELVGLARGVEHRAAGVVPEPDGAGLVRAARDRDLVLEVGVMREQVAVM